MKNGGDWPVVDFIKFASTAKPEYKAMIIDVAGIISTESDACREGGLNLNFLGTLYRIISLCGMRHQFEIIGVRGQDFANTTYEVAVGSE